MCNHPSNLADLITEEDFKKAQTYNLDKSRFGFVAGLYKQALTVLLIHYDALPKIWDFSGELLYKFSGYGKEYETLQTLVFLTIFLTASTITDLPISLYSNFVVEERYGFNKFVFQVFSIIITLIIQPLFLLILSPIDSVIGFLEYVHERKCEYEADAYALKLGYSSTLRTALIKLSVNNLGGFNYDAWYSAWNRSHPSLVERLNALGVKSTSDKPIVVEEKKGMSIFLK